MTIKQRPVLVGLIAAAIGAALFMVYSYRFEAEMSGGETVAVLASVSRIERGAVISGEHLTTRMVPQAYLDERQIRASDREKVLGLRAAEPINVAQTLQWGDVLATREDKRDLSSLVEPGRRAVTAPFTALPTYAMIRPGDFVDVVATLPQGNGDHRISSVLLQRVLVLAIGNRTAGDRSDEVRRGNTQPQPFLTLSLDLHEAQLLSLASQRGSLSVALRNPNDQRVTQSPSTLEGLTSADSMPSLESLRANRPPGAAKGPVRLEDSGK